MKRVLAVLNHWPSAERILEKAQKIAAAIHGEVTVYCPVSSQLEEMNSYVGFANFEDLKEELMADSNSRLASLPGIDGLDVEVEWQSQTYRGVVQKAEELGAEMLVISRCQHNLFGDFLHKPDDWHLLRDSACPILILNQEPRQYHGVIAAVDALEEDEHHRVLHGRILDEAKMMSEILQLPLKVITVVPEPSYIYSDATSVSSATINNFREDIMEITRNKQQELLSRLGVTPHSAEVIMGRVERELQQVLSEAGLLVIGTIASKGLRGFFIGNTSERLLGNLQGDMLVVQ